MHGDPNGSVDRDHIVFGSRLLDKSNTRGRYERWKMREDPCYLDQPARTLTRQAIETACRREQWSLVAAHVRSNHVHVVVSAEQPPEKIMGTLKSCASRALNDAFGSSGKRWSRHGSTRWLWEREHVTAAVAYVLHQQGRPMEVYVDAHWAQRI